MSSTTFNVLRVYGKADHQDRVCKVIRALFEATPWAPKALSEKPGTLLAIVIFEWLGESLVEFVAELSWRMPSETFDLRTEVHSSDHVGVKRLLLVAGQVVDDPESVYQSYDEETLQLRYPEEPILVRLNDGSVDYVSIVIAKINRVYRMVHDDIVDGPHRKQKMQKRSLTKEVKAVVSLLTPEEMHQVERHAEQQNQKANEVFARTQASNSLQRTVEWLANPNVACLLDEEDRRTIEQLSLLSIWL